MKKKILMGVGVLVLAVGLFAGYEVLIGTKKSPKATAEFNQGGLDVKVVYCRPYKKNRLIFGDKEAGALVPFGKYWRLGANAATAITFAKNVSFAGKPVNAGTYRMYAVPGASTWKVVLNSEIDTWGAGEADHGKDVLTIEVPAETAAQSVEQFTIGFAGGPPDAKMEFMWDTTVVRIPLAAN